MTAFIKGDVLDFTDGIDRRCRVCGKAGGHMPACPVVALAHELRELMAHLGVFVANMRESLETMERLLTDRRGGL